MHKFSGAFLICMLVLNGSLGSCLLAFFPIDTWICAIGMIHECEYVMTNFQLIFLYHPVPLLRSVFFNNFAISKIIY